MPPWLDNIHDLAYFYLDFMRALELERVHVVGHSLGGWLACEIAVRSTARIATLTLVAPAGLRAPGVQKFDVFLATHEATTRAAFHDPAFADRAARAAARGRRARSRTSKTASRSRASAGSRGSTIRTYTSGCTASTFRRSCCGALTTASSRSRTASSSRAGSPARARPSIAACGHSPQIEAARRVRRRDRGSGQRFARGYNRRVPRLVDEDGKRRSPQRLASHDGRMIGCARPLDTKNGTGSPWTRTTFPSSGRSLLSAGTSHGSSHKRISNCSRSGCERILSSSRRLTASENRSADRPVRPTLKRLTVPGFVSSVAREVLLDRGMSQELDENIVEVAPLVHQSCSYGCSTTFSSASGVERDVPRGERSTRNV